MRIANVAVRATLVDSAGFGSDVEQAGDGKFASQLLTLRVVGRGRRPDDLELVCRLDAEVLQHGAAPATWFSRSLS